MEIADGTVVSIHYKLTSRNGELLDSSEGAEPLTYLHGAGNIISGLENALAGRETGEHVEVEVAPADGYGEHQPDLVHRVPKSAFAEMGAVQPGMRFRAEGPNGATVVTVTDVAAESVTVDGNHPLAGETLCFAVDVAEVREATEEETSHGHVHGPGGHHHE